LLRFYALWLLLLFVASVSRAQVNQSVSSNWRSKKIPVRADTLSLDSLSVVPGTFMVEGSDASAYELNEVRAKLWWKHRPASDSVKVSYRVFPYLLQHNTYRYRYDSISKYMVVSPFYIKRRNDEDPTQMSFGNITYNGSFGRSLSFGNNQDAVVNSSLNLQINGYLGDSIQLSAAITDNNVPVQPDGTTQQLNEFDKVYIQFRKKGWQVALGDIDIRRNEGSYYSFFKRLQGISVEDETRVGKAGHNHMIFSGAVSKGIYAVNVFQGQEGNQGPYPFQGNNNETYFVVLAGTEKVFIDGVQMQRGEDQDYTINYNTAEVTFTAKRMISKDQRIQVEFEYANQNYLNSQFIVGDDLDVNKRLHFNLNYYYSADAKNSPLNQVLTDAQKQFLANLGDSVQRAYYPSATQDTFSASAVMYAMRDSIVGGVVYDSVFVYSTNPDSAIYSVAFTDMGLGNGDYILAGTAATGNVYQWSPPLGGVKTGQYEPVILLVAPQKQQLLSLGSSYQLDRYTKLTGEWALSDYNPNTFAVGKVAQVGMAGKVGITREQSLDSGKVLSTNASMEWVGQDFKPIERLRSPEFYRDWGLPIVVDQENERLGMAGIGIAGRYGGIRYDWAYFTRGQFFSAEQNKLTQTWKRYGWQWRAQLSLTTFDSAYNRGTYLKPSLELDKLLLDLGKVTVGAKYDLESDVINNRMVDTLDGSSYAFDTWQFFLKSPEGKRKWGISYAVRRDKTPIGRYMDMEDISKTLNGYWEWTANVHHQVKINATYRELDVSATKISTLLPENSILGRAEYLTNLWKGALTGNLLYELGAGQEQQRQYTYVQVPAGQGQYEWIDYNHDGIAEVNEFVIAQFQDQADYIKVYQPTGNYVKADYTTLNYSLILNPSMIWKNSKTATPAEKFLSKFMSQSSMQVNKKVISNDAINWNPFSGSATDTSLLSLTEVISNAIFFNKLSPVWGLDFTHSINSNKAYLTYGAQSQRLRDLGFRLRWNLSKAYSVNVANKFDINSMLTPAYANQNYEIHSFQTEPQVSYIKGTKYRLTLGCRYLQQEDAPDWGGEHSVSKVLTLDTKYNVVSNTSISGHFEVNGITFTGTDQTTTVAYTMLQGLTTGTNYVWSINFTKRLLSNIEVTLTYDGRKPGEGTTVNTGRASVRALF
jgi:hypothetical protein